MQGIKIVCVGKVKETYFKEGIAFYMERIRKRCPVEILECADEPAPEDASPEEVRRIKDAEGERILAKIREEDYVAALCADGKQFDTAAWREHIRVCGERTAGAQVFVIGGSLGLSDAVLRRADEQVSFSAMTFPHRLMRLILCEQLAAALVP